MRAIIIFALFCGCSSKDYTQLYKTSDRAPSLSGAEISDLDHLGATLIDGGVNLGVYSENAARIDVLIFTDPESNRPTRQFELTRFGDVWNIFIEGVGLGLHYGYIAWGPNWPYVESWQPGDIDGFIADVDAQGHRFNPNKLLIDPYARALHRDHDWTKGSTASGPARTDVTYAAAAKAVVVQSEHQWSAGEQQWRELRKQADAPGHRWNDLIVYEVHLKGLSAGSASGVEHHGTYRGFGEMAGYLEDLGITAVEIMPIHEKPLDGGYWGYQTIGFFAPELSYAADTDVGGAIDEFKWMVEQLHAHGIEVILDVVYNHTGEGGLWREQIEQDDFAIDPSVGSQMINFDPKEIAGLYSFRGLDNVAYYALSEDKQTYWNNTGVGNQTRTNHVPMRRLIVDSLRYWTDEMHVDGFRFDLAPVLGERDLDYHNGDYAHDEANWSVVNETVLQDIIDDPVLQAHNSRIISEPWSIAGFYLGRFPASTDRADTAWFDWNANFRDFWRSFINIDSKQLNSAEGVVDAGASLTGSYDLFAAGGRHPYHSLNFVTVHDGFTMYDLFSYNEKLNSCGVLNPACCDENRHTPFCDRDSGEDNNRSRDWGQDNEHLKRQMMRNMFAAMLLSHGTPMLLGGDEWMRTQLGNNNAYSSGADNAWNWFRWGEWLPNAQRRRMHDFVRALIAFRKDHAYAYAPTAYDGGAASAWKNATNSDMTGPDWNGRHVMMHYWDASAGPELAVLINMELGSVPFDLPQGGSWNRVIDTQAYFDMAPYLDDKDEQRSWNITSNASDSVPGFVYSVPSRSIVVLERQ